MSHSSPKAFLFDLNGTMIDDMSYHAEAWYDIINNDLNGGLTYDQVKVQMYGKNEEVLKRIFGNDRFPQEEMDNLSIEKEKRYQAAYKPKLELIKGLKPFLDKALEHGIPMAIGSAAIPFNIDFVLDNLNIRHYFKAIVSADDVTHSKPDPQTYLDCAEKLQMAPEKCIVFEDAPKGVESAQNAGMQSVVLTTMHEEYEFSQYNNTLFFIKDYTDDKLEKLF
ncbi:HAD family phosphatase [Danxiaibacter flavus]|uniref:HAD family phosphatase n=1 Tax=Danxiaibacter flavus TaxID=3049108 RepID=A0ABV3ZCJ2_9BACT|nr:HAD family phosphatase [Chitinophagaceae bacterium DXS]